MFISSEILIRWTVDMIKSLNTFEKLISYSEETELQIFEIMEEVESGAFEISVEEIREKAKRNIDEMKNSVKNGLLNTEKSQSGLSGGDCVKLVNSFKKKPALFGSLYEKISSYSLAVIEENARMGKIVACPTAGSCGIVASVIVAMSEEFKLSADEEVNMLITAGTIGYIVGAKLAPAGAVGGCQAECGLASAMAAAACVYALKGTARQIVTAATLALKNILGLTCDPVLGLVEVPCVKRNVFLSTYAITAAELAMAGIESKISPDDVVDALVQTGQLMSPLLKETSQGGLAATKSAQTFRETIKF